MNLLEIKNLSADYGLLRAVRDVSFSLKRGEVLAVVGANGAGKTTLFRTISGVHPAVLGSIRLYNNDVTRLAPYKRVAAGIAMVPEGRRLFNDMTVKENLIISGENGRTGSWTMDKVIDALPVLKSILNVSAGSLSGGQQQAVAIGRALMSNPHVLLLDEVSLGLSPMAVKGLYESLGNLKETRRTGMVLVEQDLDRAMGFADRILCMLEGAIAMEGISAGIDKKTITNAYFGLRQKEPDHA
ncbi:MAG: ABC transporter ATP-binding protein [Desulfobacula sp.]|jgi:branched-chain amino acid transport system ATP-binding protein